MSTVTQQIVSVKWFSSKKGFGFLTDCESGEDVFVHFSGINVPEDVYKTLIEGEYVQYELSTEKTDGKQTAQNVTGVLGGPLLCQNPNKKIHLVNRVSDYDDESSGHASRNTRRPDNRGGRGGKGGRSRQTYRGERDGGRGGDRGGDRDRYQRRDDVPESTEQSNEKTNQFTALDSEDGASVQ